MIARRALEPPLVPPGTVMTYDLNGTSDVDGSNVSVVEDVSDQEPAP